MKGAKAELSVKTINAPSSIKVIMMGPSHHFFLTLRKSHNSFAKETLEEGIVVSLMIFCGNDILIRFELRDASNKQQAI